MQGSPVRLCSVNIVVRDSRGRTLLQMRDSAAKSSPLLWGFWGGAVDADDESAHHAAARELCEELCVTAQPGDFEPIGERVDSRGRLAALFLYGPFLRWEDIRVNEGAGAAFFWREEIDRLSVSNAVAWYLERHPHIFPGVDR
ncbi:pyrimidine (deoxy)nucleoside triphosphate pyrophosphohydrolase [Caballeronia pedi]|uniref:Pyrimidine (Deoxy)nucleoside triphosphate pyrophosphohydrolase n=1 Tax=Caballeronia pedi TaxID=1777141 RepID=A0A158CZ78_9BURK|nr:NUDIX hydrolase [Caballeronia pedi]SAK87674.1 pyrimidine (deoxy)nucleoside triphosphate pyrophosphohydrolase [Caballeronia pedi]